MDSVTSNYERNITVCRLLPPAIPEAVNIIQAIIAALSALVSAPINIFLFIIIIKFPELHQRSLYLPIQIIGIEIIYHVTIPITIVVSTVNKEWVLGDIMCNITGTIHDGFAMFRFSMTLVLTFDRFLSVYKPFFYFKHGAIVSWTHSAVMWLMTLVRVVVPLAGILNCFTYVPMFKTCTAFPGCSNSCAYFTGWSVGMVVLTGVILPLLLYGIILYITCRITKYHEAIRASVSETDAGKLQAKEGVRKKINVLNNKKKFVTLSILFTSILGTAPAFTLYVVSLFQHQPSKVVIIVNILIGRTCFNLIPFFDGIAFSRHQDIRKVSLRIFQSVKRKFSPEVFKLGHVVDRNSSFETNKSIGGRGDSLS